MLTICVHFQLLDHRVAERALRQHALDRFFQRATWKTLLHFQEIGFVDAAWIAAVTIVCLFSSFGTCDAQLARIDHDDEIAGVDVRSKFRFVFAAQSECHFAGNTFRGLCPSRQSRTTRALPHGL